ncbi:MAG: hypothetical protein Kow0090_06900 [Myxococcota bacterium]
MVEIKAHLNSSKEIKKVTLIGAVINLILSAVKIIGGEITHSFALIADGLHSLSDLITDVVVYAGAEIGARPPDDSHPYGHGKFETLSANIVALALIAVGGGIAWKAIAAIHRHESVLPGGTVLILATLSLLVKEGLFHYTKVWARKTGSPALLANAWHHRSDALSSVAVVVGAIFGLMGYDYADSIAGIVVALMVIIAGLKIILEGLDELMEKSLGNETLKRIEKIFNGKPEIKEWHKLRTRRVGREAFIDVHILLDPEITLLEGHKIADEIEEAIRTSLHDPVNITIHIEPYLL